MLPRRLVLPLVFLYILIGCTYGAVVVHPSESNTYYIIDNSIVNSTTITITPTSVSIGGVVFQVSPTENSTVYVYISKWNLTGDFKFTVQSISKLYQRVIFSIGRLIKANFSIYKNGKLYTTLSTSDGSIMWTDFITSTPVEYEVKLNTSIQNQTVVVAAPTENVVNVVGYLTIGFVLSVVGVVVFIAYRRYRGK